MKAIEGINLSNIGEPVVGYLRVMKKPSDLRLIRRNEIILLPKKLVVGDGLLTIYSIIAKNAIGIISDIGGSTDHGTVIASELSVPRLLISSENVNSLFKFNGKKIGISDSTVFLSNLIGNKQLDVRRSKKFKFTPTHHHVKVNIGFPEIIERHPDLVELSDGVGLIRMEFIMLGVLKRMHPGLYIHTFGLDSYVNKLADVLEKIVRPFAEKKKEVWLCTNDFTPGDLLQFKGGKTEYPERNPALGYRGIFRSLREQETMLVPEIRAIKQLVDKGYRNLGIFAPMSRFVEEVLEWKKKLHSQGLRNIKVGLQVETPSIALTVEKFTKHVDFISFGSNDLTQFTLAIDRSDPRLNLIFNEQDDAVIKLFESVIRTCMKHGVETNICGQAGSDWKMVEKLLRLGLTSTSVFPRPQTIQDMKEHILDFERYNPVSMSRLSIK